MSILDKNFSIERRELLSIELGWRLIDALVLILAVTKVRAPSFNRAAACELCRGEGALVDIAFVWLLLVK